MKESAVMLEIRKIRDENSQSLNATQTKNAKAI